MGGEYRLGTQGRLYARHELISSLSGGNGLNDTQQRNTTVVGIEDEYMKDGRVFSEYRVRDAISATEAEAAIGRATAGQPHDPPDVRCLFPLL